MKTHEKVLVIIAILYLALIVCFQNININDLQEKTDYLFDEVYECGETLYELQGGD